MSSCSPRNFRYLIYALVAGLSFTGHAMSAPDPVLDLTALGGSVVDGSASQRTLKVPKLSPGSDGNAVVLSVNKSLRVPFNEGDALYAPGPWTWLIRCKFQRVLSDKGDIFVASRWEGAGDQRIIVLSIDGASGRGRFQVSATGALDSTAGVQSKSPIPEGEWITLVGRFEPGKDLTLQVFTAGGELIESAERSKNVPEQLPQFSLPIVIGRGISSDMEFARLRAWTAALSDDEIKALVTEK